MGVEKVFSAADWQRNHPADHLPGDRVDSQFDNHANAIRDLEGRIARLLRADGKLAHDLLTVESFPQDLHEAMARQIVAEAHADRALADAAFRETQNIRREVAVLLDEARTFVEQSRREFAQALALAQNITTLHEDLRDRVALLAAQAADTLDTADNTQNDAAFAAATAQDWAQVSIEWAEHMPDTIPPNILAITGISGNHWSSRWWASQAAATISGFTGVQSFNGRSGTVAMILQDITDAGGAPIASPLFIGNPRGPTPAYGDSDNSFATTAFVQAALSGSVAGVSSFNTRQGDVVLTNADVVAVFPGSNVAPLMDGVAGAGTGIVWSRSDHVHPSDTSRLALSGGTMTGPLTLANDPATILQPVTLRYLQAYTIDIGTY